MWYQFWLMLLGGAITLNATNTDIKHWSCNFNAKEKDCFLKIIDPGPKYGSLTQTSGPTPNTYTGPDAPFEGDAFLVHTFYYGRTGHISMVPKSKNWREGDYCLQMVFHVWGDIPASSETGIGVIGGLDPLRTRGSYGNKWFTHTEDFQNPNLLEVRFFSDAKYPRIDMAIDDVELYKRKCLCTSFPCKNGGTCNEDLDAGTWNCICRKGTSGKTCEIFGNGSLTCNLAARRYTPGDCFFRDANSKFFPGKIGDFVIGKGNTPFLETGPVELKGQGSDYYLYVDSRNTPPDVPAMLEFNNFLGNCKHCFLHFLYLMVADAGILTIEVNGKQLKNISRTPQFWRGANVIIPCPVMSVKIIYYSITSSPYRDVVLGNIRLNYSSTEKTDDSV